MNGGLGPTLSIDEYFCSFSIGPEQHCFLIDLLIGVVRASFHSLQ